MTEHRLGDGPIEDRYHQRMNDLAGGLDRFLNGELRGADRRTGFVLLVFPFNDDTGRCNYISNADREDIIAMLKEQIARFEDQAEA